MEQYTITYEGALRTTAHHHRSGTSLLTDAPVDNRGKGESFSPTDLVAAGLGTCILTVMGIAAKDHQIDIKGAKAEVKKIMASNPRRIAEIKVNIQMPPKKYSDKEKNILEEAAHHCPVENSLADEVEETITFQYNTA